jgi:hypothetical protein
MTRADSYLHLLEGFKLGSLGARSKKPIVVVPNIEPELPKPKVWGFSKPDEDSMTWTQYFEPETIKKLKLYDAKEGSDLTIKMSVDFVVSTSRYLPQLVFLKKSNENMARKGTFVPKKLSFGTLDAFRDWLHRGEEDIKEKGIDLEQFQRYWKKVTT